MNTSEIPHDIPNEDDLLKVNSFPVDEVSFMFSMRALTALADESLSNEDSTTDLRGLKIGDLILGGVPERQAFVVKFEVISNDGNMLRLKRVEEDGSYGKSIYFTFIGRTESAYRLYRSGKEGEQPLTFLPHREKLPRNLGMIG